MPIIRAVLRNYSRFPIDAVWENAQDLEHVTVLHKDTNASFTLMDVEKLPGSTYVYDRMVYRARRRTRFFTFETFGFRWIIEKYRFHQIEYIPIFKTTSALNSFLVETKDPARPTMLLDEVVMDVPALLYPMRNIIIRSLQRHTAIQCRQDEPFRERRMLLREKGLRLPFRLFNESVYSKLTARFEKPVN